MRTPTRWAGLTDVRGRARRAPLRAALGRGVTRRPRACPSPGGRLSRARTSQSLRARGFHCCGQRRERERWAAWPAAAGSVPQDTAGRRRFPPPPAASGVGAVPSLCVLARTWRCRVFHFGLAAGGAASRGREPPSRPARAVEGLFTCRWPLAHPLQ